jgi:hypothetical protein
MIDIRLEVAGESKRRPARDPAASRLSDPSDCGARRETGDHGEGPEPRAAPVQSPSLSSGARRAPCPRALGRTRHNRLQAGDAGAGHRGVPASRLRACAASGDIGGPEAKRTWRCPYPASMSPSGGLTMSVACLGIDIGPVPDCPSCSLRSEPAAGRFKAAVAPRGGRSSLSARGQARGPLRSRPAGPQPCPAGSAESDL